MLIVLDIDDTILARNSKEINDYTINIFKKLNELGHLIVYNTARDLSATKFILNNYLPNYFIFNSGSQIYDNNYNILFDKKIDLITTKEIFSLFNELKPKSILVSKNGKTYSNDKNYQARHPHITYDDFSNLNEDVNKIVCCLDNDASLVLKEKFPHLNIVNYVGGPFYKITATNKAFGLQELQKLLNYPKTIAFGDDITDLEMLLLADKGIIMKNSQKELFNYDFEVTSSCVDNGVASYLEEHLIKKEDL